MANPKTGKYKELQDGERRKSISFTKTLQGIDEAEQLLVAMLEKNGEPSNARVGAIKALLDSKYKKLNKLLPDLKAVEMSGEVQSIMVFERPAWLK